MGFWDVVASAGPHANKLHLEIGGRLTPLNDRKLKVGNSTLEIG